MTSYFKFIKKISQEARRVEIPRHAAALAFYAIYALAPIIIIFVSLSGFIVGQGLVEDQIVGYFELRTGGKAVPFVEDFLNGLKESRAHFLFSAVGLLILFYGLSHFFNTLKKAFFDIFGIHFGPVRGVNQTLFNILKSVYYSVFLAGFIILLTFLNIVIPLFTRSAFSSLNSSIASSPVLIFSVVFVLMVFSLAFMYKVVSVGRVNWRDSFFGGFLGALLFSVLNILLSLYFSLFYSAHAIYGASSSLIAFLLWIYSVSQILLFGALGSLLSKEFRNDQ